MLEHIDVKLVNVWNVDAVNCVSAKLYVLLFPIRYPQGKLQEVLHSESSNSHSLRLATSLEKWQDGESVRGRGGIILALAPAYSPFVAAYFGALRCSCKFSRESEVETQSSFRGLIFSPTRQHHQYNCMSDLSLSAKTGGRVLQRKLSHTNLPVWDTGS